MSLVDLGIEHGTDKVEHGYLPHYETHLGYLRDRECALLEIGVGRGGSVKMWSDWLPQAHVFGVDIEDHTDIEYPRVKIAYTDIKRYWPLLSLDVIIDDGSHQSLDILAALARLWPHLAVGGWYVVEDLDVQWEPHGWCCGEGGSPVISVLSDMLRRAVYPKAVAIAELHAYPNICFMRKGGDAL